MSEQFSTGGPAFPTRHPAMDPRESGFHTEEGMTLRDYFAAKAMQGIISNPSFDMDAQYKDVATAVYSMADAMIAAREAKP